MSVDDNGCERDEYDLINPLYLIAESNDGLHLASLRLLQTMGDTMINDHFLSLAGGVTIRSPFIWECTRFYLAPSAPSGTSRLLAEAAKQLGKNCHVDDFIGVFDRAMLKVYHRIGWSPGIIETKGSSQSSCLAGLWITNKEKEKECALGVS